MKRNRQKVLIIEWMNKNPSIDFKEFLELENYCALCGEKYTPRIKSVFMNTYYKCCDECLKKARARTPYDREAYKQRKLYGLCVNCGSPYDHQQSGRNHLCPDCRRKYREYKREYNSNRYNTMKLYGKENGICPSCGQKVSDGDDKIICKSCRTRYRHNKTLKYSEKNMKSLEIGDDFPIRARYRAIGEVIGSITKLKDKFIIRTNVKEYVFNKIKGDIYIYHFSVDE